MNQHILCHFNLTVNDKYFEFCFQPGITNFDDIYLALEEFKKEIDVLKEKAVEAEAKAKAEKSQQEATEPAVDAEVVA